MFGFLSVSSHVASNSRHIRIFCDSIWNILHNLFVFEHRLLMLAEYISPLLLVLLWFWNTYGIKEHVRNIILWMGYDIFARWRSLVNFLQQIVCDRWRAASFELSNLSVFPDSHVTQWTKKFELKHYFLCLKNITFFASMNVFSGAGDRSGFSWPFI